MAKQPPRIITRKRALACLAMNTLAFPGVGTIMAGRWIGFVQAFFMSVGFCLFAGFVVWYIVSFSQFAMSDTPERFIERYVPWLWALWMGLALSAFAWLWSLLSSLVVLRQASPA